MKCRFNEIETENLHSVTLSVSMEPCPQISNTLLVQLKERAHQYLMLWQMAWCYTWKPSTIESSQGLFIDTFMYLFVVNLKGKSQMKT